MRPVAVRVVTGTATLVIGGGVVLGALAGSPEPLVAGLVGLVPLAVALVVVHHSPRSQVGPALAWVPGGVALVTLVGERALGVWPLNVAGLLWLLLVFPDGPPRARVWRSALGAYAAGTLVVLTALSGSREIAGRLVTPDDAVWRGVLATIGILGVGVGLVVALGGQVASYRHGDERRRGQVRWLAVAGVIAVAALVGGWAAETLGASLGAAYLPHLVVIVVLLPLAVGVAMVRHDLFDVDRLLSATVAGLLTLVAAAVVFGGTVVVVSEALGPRLQVGTAGAAFVTALVLLPLHRHVVAVVGRVVDGDTHRALAMVTGFAADVRSGRREPEEIETVLRQAQRDPGLRVALAAPDAQWVDLRGEPVDDPGDFTVSTGGDVVARLRLGWDSTRARGRLGRLAVAAWLPLEVSRLRVDLRRAAVDVEASRARLADAAAVERRRLERDLHDGIQQRVVATGMRLRRLQRGLDADRSAEVDAAVDDLEATVRELRRLASGVRPARLDDGLASALEELRAGSPVPLHLRVAELPDLGEARAHTAYLVVAEAVANALKHAAADRIDVEVGADAGRLVIEIRDDGTGGVPDGGLLGLLDRVAAVGGDLQVASPVGHGTVVRAVL